MSDDFSLDLDRGDPDRADRITAAAEGGKSTSRRSRRDSSSGGSSRKSSSKTASSKSETDLVGRLSSAIVRLADQLDARNDTELAEALREDSDKISRGLVSVTRTVKFLRQPLVLFIGVLEPVLAFWRVGAILGRRLLQRRARMLAEREAAMAEQAAQVTPDEYAVTQ